MARRKKGSKPKGRPNKAKKQSAREVKKATNQAIREKGGFVTSMDEKLARQQALLEQGKVKKAKKVGKRIEKQAMRQPQTALPIAQEYAKDAFDINLIANRPNQQAIGGGREYITDPETGQVTVKDSLAPEQQALYDQQIAGISAANNAFMQGLQGGNFGSPFDFSGLPQAPNTGDLAGERQRIESTLYDRNVGLYNKNQDRQRQQLEDQLVRTGNPPGSPRYTAAMQEFNEQYQAGERDIRQQAVATAGSEFERSFNIGSQGRKDRLGEQVLGRTQPLSELATLHGFGGGPTAQPNFFNFQPIQYQGPQYLDFLQTGVDAQLARQGLDLERLAINKAGGGGGPSGPAGPSFPPFSIGGLPPTPAPVPGSAPNPVAGGFAAGLGAGVAR